MFSFQRTKLRYASFFKQVALVFVFMCAVGSSLYAQNITGYSFFVESNSPYTSLAGTTTATQISSVRVDEGTASALPIGFSFRFLNQQYTEFGVSSNGWMMLGDGVLSPQPTNNLQSAANRPIIAPLWDNLDLSSGQVNYRTTGNQPNRVLTVEWHAARWNNSATTASMSFQAKLYERTGRVEFVYSQETGATVNPSASIGIAGTASGSYLSVNGVGTTATVSNTTETITISDKPATGRLFAFQNLRPTIDVSVDKIQLTRNTATSVTLSLYDSDTPFSSLMVSVTSSNPVILPTSSVVQTSATAATVTMLLTPAQNRNEDGGIVTFTVTDPQGNIASTTLKYWVDGLTRTVTNPTNSGAGTLRDAVRSLDNISPIAEEILTTDDIRVNFAASVGIVRIIEPVTLNRNLTIDGNGTNNLQVIDGSSRTNVFVVKSTTAQPFLVKVQNVALVNGAGTTASAGIHHENGNLEVANVRIENSTSSSTNGGGISSVGKISLTNVVVTQCSASGQGGGLYLSATADAMIHNSTFDNNTAGLQGGGISTLGKTAVTNTTIRNGSTATTGGGLYATGSAMVTISNSSVEGNTAVNGGAGIHLTGFASLTSNTVQVRNNNTGSSADGGGIYVENSARIVDMNSTIERNSARNGGGLFTNVITGTQVEFHGTMVSANSASQNGGGVYAVNSGTTLPRISMTSFRKNSALLDGGGVYLAGSGTVSNPTIMNITLDSNTAGRDGGGVYSMRLVSFSKSQISHNRATRNGGGLYQINERLSFMHSTSANNTAASGGGMYLSDDNGAMISKSYIANNTATGNGGGVFVASQTVPISHLQIQQSTIVANRAEELGGGIYTAYPFEVVNATISGNQARTTTGTLSGGGIYVGMNAVNATSSLVNVTLVNNLSPNEDGGAGLAVSSAGNGITMQNTMVANNISTTTAVRRNLKLSVSTSVISLGYNLIGNIGAQQWASTTGDLVGSAAAPINPGIAPIAINGNGTPTHLIQASSPAVNAGTNASMVQVDQRGYLRVGRYDIGAFEFGALPAPVLTAINPNEIFQAVNAVPLQFQGQNLVNPTISMEVVGSANQTVLLSGVTGSSTSVNASIPTGFAVTAGTVRFSVETIGGSTTGSITILPLIAPTIASVTPNVTNVSVNAMNFQINGQYFFQPAVELRVLRANGTPGGILPLNVVSSSTTQIRSIIPAGYLATIGTLTVRVRTAAGTTSAAIVVSELPAPSLISPTNGTVRFTQNNTQNILLRWSSVSEASSYTFQVASSTSFANIITSGTVTTRQRLARNLPVNARYYWRVKANRNTGESPWSPTWNFAVVSPVAVTISQTADFICDSADVELTANPSGGLAAFVGNVDYKYRWFVKRESDSNFVEAVNANGGRKTFIAPMLDQTVRYRVRVIDASDADTAFAETIVVVRPKPFPVITGKKNACENAEATYTVVNNLSAQGNSYLWTVSGGEFVGSNSSATVTVLWGSAGSGFLSLTETAGSGCFRVTELPVTILAPTEYAISGESPVCLETQTATFEYSIPEVPGATSYAWSANNGAVISADGNKASIRWNLNTQEGSVSVVVGGENIEVCPSISPLSVLIGRKLEIDVRPDETGLVLGDTLSLSVNIQNRQNNASYTYSWSPAESLDDASSRTPKAFPTDTTVYTITVTDDRTGCSTSENVTINVLNNVSVEEYAAKKGFVLMQNTPNPFKSETAIRYSLTRAGQVSITVRDMFGKEVYRIERGMEVEGDHAVSFNADELSQGVYYVTVTFEELSLTKTMMLVK